MRRRVRESVEAAITHAVAALGSLDVLVNNAFGCTPDVPLFENTPDDTWARALDLTLTSAFRCSRASLPHLVASGRGAIVNIGSGNGLQDFGNHAYSAAKAGLISLTRTLAGDAAPRGVRVNLVAPGTVRTPGRAGRGSCLDDLAEIYPLGRVGQPTDIAAAVAFLASRDAAWITGTTLRVDGGLLAVNTAFAGAARRWREEGEAWSRGPPQRPEGARSCGTCGCRRVGATSHGPPEVDRRTNLRRRSTHPIAATIPSQNRARASNASTAVSTASSHRPSTPPHRSATMAIAIGVCSSPSTSMCRAR